MNTEHIIQSVVCMLAIDGSIDEQERRFLQQLQRRLGVPAKVLQQSLNLAKQGKGSVKLPDEVADQQRVFEVLVHAALADGVVTPQERRILDAVGAKIGLRKDLIERSINFYAGEARKAASEQAAAGSSVPPPPVPQASPSAPQESKNMTCPKCGTEQEPGRTDCLHCGIIFSRFTGEPASEAPVSGEPAPKTPQASPRKSLYPEYDDDAGKATEQLEQLQSFSVLMSHAGAIVAAVAILIFIGYAVSHTRELGGYRYPAIFGMVLAAVLVIGHFTILNIAGVVTRGEVTNK